MSKEQDPQQTSAGAPAPHGTRLRRAGMELWDMGFVVPLQMTPCTPEAAQAFEQGFDHYHFIVGDMPVPIALWLFPFPHPLGPVLSDLNARRVPRERLKPLLEAAPGEALGLRLMLLDGRMPRSASVLALHPEATALFAACVRRQLDTAYRRADYLKYLQGLAELSPDDLAGMGTVFPAGKS